MVKWEYNLQVEMCFYHLRQNVTLTQEPFSGRVADNLNTFVFNTFGHIIKLTVQPAKKKTFCSI